MAAWNPRATRDADGVPLVATGVRWHGPVPLAPVINADADLPVAWSVGYVAEVVERSDSRAADARATALAPETAACRLVRGLARLLHGTARLPRSLDEQPSHDPHELVVYGHEPLPWRVLREVVRMVAPRVDRSAMYATDDYTLADADTLSVRAAPCEPFDLLPYALRPHVDATWPLTTYRIACHARGRDAAASSSAREQISRCASLLCDAVDGFVLDGDGFPLVASLTRDLSESLD